MMNISDVRHSSLFAKLLVVGDVCAGSCQKHMTRKYVCGRNRARRNGKRRYWACSVG